MQNALNEFRYLAHPTTGPKRKALLPLYQTLIRSILDYGSLIDDLSPGPVKHYWTLIKTPPSAYLLTHSEQAPTKSLRRLRHFVPSFPQTQASRSSISSDSPYQRASSLPFYSFRTLMYTISYSAQISNDQPTTKLPPPYQFTFKQALSRKFHFQCLPPTSPETLYQAL